MRAACCGHSGSREDAPAPLGREGKLGVCSLVPKGFVWPSDWDLHWDLGLVSSQTEKPSE